jgi:hypothetical protein
VRASEQQEASDRGFMIGADVAPSPSPARSSQLILFLLFTLYDIYIYLFNLFYFCFCFFFACFIFVGFAHKLAGSRLAKASVKQCHWGDFHRRDYCRRSTFLFAHNPQ